MALHPQARAAIAAEEAEPSPFDPSFDIDASRREARESAAKDPREPVDHVEDVEADVEQIFVKLGLGDEHAEDRRVAAVLTYLRATAR